MQNSSDKEFTVVEQTELKNIFKERWAGRLTYTERMAAGKALRQQLKRSNQGVYQVSASRIDPIAILEAEAKTVCRSWCLTVMVACWHRLLHFCVGRLAL